MKRLLQCAGALWLICAGITGGMYAAGHSVVGWPFYFFNFPVLPPDSPQASFDAGFDDDVFPAKVGAFTRAPFGTGSESNPNGRVLYSYTAQYFPLSGDQQRGSVFITATQFDKADAANLLITPSDLRLYSSTENIFYALSPMPYKFTAINKDYHRYTVALVSGRWNVIIECTNAQNLIEFANQYRR